LVTGDEVRTAGFRERWHGYDPKDIDPFLEKVAAELDAGRSAHSLVAAVARFDKKKLRGYHPKDVDALLARLKAG
jgi:DivIVA domain-containing protein